METKERKEGTLIIRLSKSEREIIEAKVQVAGYKATGAFVRDYIVNCTPKTKVSSDVVQIARELMNLASMINAEKPGSELLDKVKLIAKINVGGAA
jgi:hypothetical protein